MFKITFIIFALSKVNRINLMIKSKTYLLHAVTRPQASSAHTGRPLVLYVFSPEMIVNTD
jgi:hypothetical protein